MRLLGVTFPDSPTSESFHLWNGLSVAKGPWRSRTINVSSSLILCSSVATFTLSYLGLFNELKETARKSQLETSNRPRITKKESKTSRPSPTLTFALSRRGKICIFLNRQLPITTSISLQSLGLGWTLQCTTRIFFFGIQDFQARSRVTRKRRWTTCLC